MDAGVGGVDRLEVVVPARCGYPLDEGLDGCGIRPAPDGEEGVGRTMEGGSIGLAQGDGLHPEGGEVGHACANGLEELLTSRLAQCQPGGSGGVELCQIVGHRGSFGSWPLRKVRKAR